MSFGQLDDPLRASGSATAYDHARADDLRFMQAWNLGLYSAVCAAARVRQIRRAAEASHDGVMFCGKRGKPQKL